MVVVVVVVTRYTIGRVNATEDKGYREEFHRCQMSFTGSPFVVWKVLFWLSFPSTAAPHRWSTLSFTTIRQTNVLTFILLYFKLDRHQNYEKTNQAIKQQMSTTTNNSNHHGQG